MSEALKFIPPRVPLTDPRTGLVSREWFLFFKGVYERVGGATGPSTEDVSGSLFEDAGSSETNSMLFTLGQDLQQAPLPDQPASQLDQLASEVAELRAQLAAMTSELEALKQSVTL